MSAKHLTGAFVRRFGFSAMCWSVALAAATGDSWVVSFVLGAFILGLGLGLGDWGK